MWKRPTNKMSNIGNNERSPAFYAGQDWSKVVIHGKPVTTNAQAPLKVSPQMSQMRKLAEAETAGKPKRLSPESKQEIILKRLNNKWTQDQLNQECRFPVNTIREIEAGRLCPSSQQLNTLNRILKTGLKYDH